MDAAESRASGDEGESEEGVERGVSERRQVEVRGEFEEEAAGTKRASGGASDEEGASGEDRVLFNSLPLVLHALHSSSQTPSSEEEGEWREGRK